MSKDKLPEVSYGVGLVMSQDSLGYVTGRVLTIIDSLGLPQKQAEAVKGLVKQAVYRDEEHYAHIDPELHTAIKTAHYKGTLEADSEQVPRKMTTLEDIK